MHDQTISGAPVRHPLQEEEGLQRRLSQRQLTMIAIGGAIGVGLFLGSQLTIHLAGPAVIVTYGIGALIVFVVAYAMGEMAVVHPQAGSFGVYAGRYLNRWSGFSVRMTYGVIQIIAIGAEVTAVAIYFTFWFPDVPQWAWVVAVSVGLVAINAMQVGNFGEFEYWFALIKVVTIVVFILVGFALIMGVGGPEPLGLRNLTAHGGFFPRGMSGMWLALTLVITSYMGVEVIAVTAGEAKTPSETIPRAMRTIVVRLVVFYVLSITIMLAMVPWTEAGSGGLTGSPFVRAFDIIGIPYAAGVMNLVVITAALSSANTNLYLSTRMLFSLARGGYLPRGLGGIARNGVPRRALAVSTAGMVAAIVLAVFAPERAFLLLYGTAVTGMLFVWVVALAAHLKFRKALRTEGVQRLPIWLPLHPLPTLLAILALIAIALTTPFVDGLHYGLPAMAVFLGVISLVYLRIRRQQRLTPESYV